MAFQFAASSDLLACRKVTCKWFNLSFWQSFSSRVYRACALECADSIYVEHDHTNDEFFVYFGYLMMDFSTVIQKF